MAQMQIEVTLRFITHTKYKIKFIDAPLSELLQNEADGNGTISEIGENNLSKQGYISHFMFHVRFILSVSDVCTYSRRTLILCRHQLYEWVMAH